MLEKGESRVRQTAAWLVLLTLGAALLRLPYLAQRSFWADEAFSICLAQLPWPQFRQIVTHSEANMSLYYILLRIWSQFSDAPGFVRGLSVLAGVATVPVIFFAGQTLFSRRAGIIAALLLAVNGFHIRYSREARSYSLTILLVTCSCLFFVRNLSSQGRTGRTGYILTSTAALYAHFFAALVLLSQFVSWTLLPPRVRSWQPLRNLIAIVLLGSPLLLFVVCRRGLQLDWVQHPTAKDAYHLFTYFTGSGLRFILFLLAIALASREWWQHRRRDDGGLGDWTFVFVICWLLLPVLVTLVVSHWKPIFVDRFLLICLPAALLVFGQGLSLMRPNWLGFAAVAVIAGGSLVALRTFYRQPDAADWKAAIRYLAQNAHSGDALIFANPYCHFPFDYNQRVLGAQLPPMSVSFGSQGTVDKVRQARHVWVVCGSGSPGSMSGLRLRWTGPFRGADIQEFEPSARNP